MADTQLRVFVSHCHADGDFCRTLVAALRDAGADVWYDEHNLSTGQLRDVIQRELGRRPIFVPVLSKAAFASRWVKREIAWADELLEHDPKRVILPVTAGPIARDDFDPETGWLFLHDFKRIEAPGYQPYPADEAARRLLRALALTAAGESSGQLPREPQESAEELLTRGKALQARGKHAEALALFERAVQFSPSWFDAWFNLAYTLDDLGDYEGAVAAWDRALHLDPNRAAAWSNLGIALLVLGRREEALAAYSHAVTLDPDYPNAWSNMGTALGGLGRSDQALAAYDRAIALDPTYREAWTGRGAALLSLGRYAESLATYERAIALDPDYIMAWYNKGLALWRMQRHEEALAAYDRAIALDSEFARAWESKASILRALGRTAEAEVAERRAKALNGAE
jgi:tetratricopeptide (TPR) repeat protein